MWTDIDYMDHRRVFTLDEVNFPLDRMQDVVQFLHDRQQHYILMVDPAVGKYDYHAYQRGLEMDVFMKREDSTVFVGVVWPVGDNSEILESKG
jgi:alpha-glucosidase